MLSAATYFNKGAVSMENFTKDIPPESAVAAELFAQLQKTAQEALIDLIKSLLSEK